MKIDAPYVSPQVAIPPGLTPPPDVEPNVPVASQQPPYMKRKSEYVIQRLSAMQAYKDTWLPDYRLVSEYVLRRKWNFSGYMYADEGSFVTENVFDATAPKALVQMASALTGALWPNGSRSVQIVPPHSMSKEDKNSKEIKDWYHHCNNKLIEVIDKPEAGFQTALEEYMKDQGCFGTSGIAVLEDEEDDNTPVKFQSVDAKRTYISEGADGYIDTVYIRRFVTIRQLVQRFGMMNVSESIRQRYLKADGTTLEQKVQYIEAIEPRREGVRGSIGYLSNQNFPIASIYIEYDTRHVLKESGYEEMPIFVTRFDKRMNEVYGRSPALENLPDILEINQRREMLLVADEKQLNPPLAVFDNGQLGGGTVNTSAGSISVFHVTGQHSSRDKVIEQILTIGDMQPSYKRVSEIEVILKEAFYIDLLNDFNNDTRMTLGEAKMRDRLRTQQLNTVYSRQQDELFDRMVKRVFNICYNRKLFGFMPDDQQAQRLAASGENVVFIPQKILDLIKQGKDAYHVEFISPAARAMKSEELYGIQQTVTYIMGLVQVDPSIADNIDFDKVAHKVQNLTGAPSDIMRSNEDVMQLRQSKNSAAAQQQKLLSDKTQSETVRAIGQGAQAAAKAGLNPEQLAGALATGAQNNAA